MGIMNIFWGAKENVPISEMEIIRIKALEPDEPIQDKAFRYQDRAINFDYILRTGVIPSRTQTLFSDKPVFVDDRHFMATGYGSQFIDFESDDAFTSALDSIRQNVHDSLAESSGEARTLLSKEVWTKEDREQWEQTVSSWVSYHVDSVPGFDNYRTPRQENNPAEYRPTRLNDLSADIENGTQTVEFDCEVMSVVEGLILQQIDKEFLPEVASEGNYKVASNYFYVVADLNLHAQMDYLGAHAFVVSSATGNIIEATADPSEHGYAQYKRHVDKDFTFEDMIRGKPMNLLDGSIYASKETFDMGGVNRIRISCGELETTNIYDRIWPGWTSDTEYSKVAGAAETDNTRHYIPEDVRELAEIKAKIYGLRQGYDDAWLKGYRDSRIAKLDRKFEEKVQEIVDGGRLHEVNEFLDTIGYRDFTSDGTLDVAEGNYTEGRDPAQRIVNSWGLPV